MTIPASANRRPYCDLVMKGGITSGVIYPKAAARLSQEYQFKNIGGTSAGAIAAAVTAAAEYARQGGATNSFQTLAGVPEILATGDRLFKMFSPNRLTKGLFALVTALMKSSNLMGAGLALVGAVLRHFFWAVLAGLLATAGVGWLAWRDLGSTGRLWGGALAVVAGTLVFGVMLLLRLKTMVFRNLPENYYGLSKVFDPRSNSTQAPLVNWLAGFLDQLAGKNPKEAPLTFGDLLSREVNLEMMTSALNHGRPYRLPFRDPDRIFYFSPDEFRTLFPERIVKHMEDHAPARSGTHPVGPAGLRMVAFPDAGDLPVVVGTRMSLSFPILIAAVPLYAVDFTRPMNQVKGEAPMAERCWFSDGGLSSNMPIHFFDQPIPRWPTFAINLKDFHPDFQQEKDAVWLPMHNNSGWQTLWTRFEPQESSCSLCGFLGSIVNVLQNWHDNTLSRVPGYRDRMVHVSQRPNEGGLNLRMSSETVERLGDRGRRAAELLIERFAQGQGWPNHEWVRFRSTLGVTTHWLRNLANPIDPGLVAFIDGGAPSYPVSAALRTDFHDGADTIFNAAQALGASVSALEANAPRPDPELAIRPRI